MALGEPFEWDDREMVCLEEGASSLVWIQARSCIIGVEAGYCLVSIHGYRIVSKAEGFNIA